MPAADLADPPVAPAEELDGSLRTRLQQRLDPELLRSLHRRQAWRHLLLGGGHLLLLGVTMAVAAARTEVWVWLPAALAAGVLLFGCTVLLHEVLHGCVFARRRPGWERLLGFAYALPLGLSPSQFRRWHLDHHRHVGDAERDPKRAQLSPKRRSRLLKLAYFTPLLFPIYFSAAARAAAGYDAALRRRMGAERLLGLLVHVGLIVAIATLWDGWAVARAWALPLLVVFPIAFSINRLGQHYWIDDSDAAKGGTRVDGNPLWHWAFLWSNFHLEHHFFPRVPFYRLPELNRALRPFFAEIDWPSRTYSQLLHHWLLRNAEPHARWTELP